jgi:hypothetical protein
VAKSDKGGIELVEGQVQSGQLDKGDTRLYKAFVAHGKTEVRLEMKREGHAQLRTRLSIHCPIL